ncbi:hypothetical protein AMYX_06140 [Anaeromyxobacter diazotrophicus]|uniref:Alginate export domain-containing protein n=2 Tax=Anaeromyxobacter diazotrophicus TaxID=2590199 RepID=A0A7I9VHJ4_9BACT|nr:hypothetical protein AMYX_06140 [Anaeromyxobacter diazotrophicus]
MMNRLRLTVFAAALAVAGAASADTVRASSTTMLLGRQDFRDGSTITAVPAYELIDVAASDVHTRYADFEVALSSWGSIDLADKRFWQGGALTDSRFTGDVNVGFIRADVLDRALTLRLGRQLIADGTARMVQIDGGSAEVRLPANFTLSGYAGSPVAPRFSTRGGTEVVGNLGATFTTGGRAAWRYPGLLDVGASVAMATDHGDWARQDVGVDFKLTPHHLVALTGSGFWSLFEDRIGEAAVAAQVFPVQHLDVTVDYRHVEPDLFLARNSILAVFAADKRNDVGGAVHFTGLKLVAIDADYHFLIEDAGHGHWARVKGTAHPGGASTTAGLELGYLKNAASLDNGYKQVRLFGAKQLYQVTGTLDLNGYFYDGAINGVKKSLLATATLGYPLWQGWRAAVAGSVGTTPYMESQFDVMAKLVYDQTYAVREVR